MLTLIIFIPLLSALALVFVKRDNTGLIKTAGIGATISTLVVSLWILFTFDKGNPGMQFVQSVQWVPALHINYLVGVDGISLWMLVLTAFLGVISLSLSLDQKKNLRDFIALILALEAGTLGVFLALDTILFYVFWELMLVPTYFIIGVWGEGRRIYATMKFVPPSFQRFSYSLLRSSSDTSMALMSCIDLDAMPVGFFLALERTES